MVDEFETESTVDWVAELGLRNVSLQLPDEMLQHAVWITTRLREVTTKRGLTAKYNVLADSSVSSWDPDVVAAQHIEADGLVVYGRASLGRVEAMPCKHVFGRMYLDVDALVQSIVAATTTGPVSSDAASPRPTIRQGRRATQEP